MSPLIRLLTLATPGFNWPRNIVRVVVNSTKFAHLLWKFSKRCSWTELRILFESSCDVVILKEFDAGIHRLFFFESIDGLNLLLLSCLFHKYLLVIQFLGFLLYGKLFEVVVFPVSQVLLPLDVEGLFELSWCRLHFDHCWRWWDGDVR